MSSHQREAWFLGIDLGTGSCKSAIIDVQGRVLGFGARGYASRAARGKWQEQDPDSLVAAMIQSVSLAMDQAQTLPDACQAISIGGAYHSLIAVDRVGKPLTGLMTWVDGRPAKQAQAVRQSRDPHRLYQQTGCPVHAMYPLYKLIWLREESPHVFGQAWRFISGKEYVLERLTGEYLLDYGVAAGTGLMNVHDFEWNSHSLELAGITPNQLSPLYSPTHVVRKLNPELASQMGVPADTVLVLGSADAVNSSLGAGAVLAGQATCMVGTSGAFRIIAPRPMLDQQARSFCYAIDQEHWLVGGAINNGGLALSWLRDALNPMLEQTAEDARISFDDLVALAAQVRPGAEALVCLPFFAGERSPYWNMNARGAFIGLTLNHDLRHIARALLEGVAYRLRSLKDVLVDLGVEVEQIRASGGFTHSQLWPKIIASVLNHQLQVPIWGETSSLGAAFWALMGSGGFKLLESLHSLVPIADTYYPDPEGARLYDTLYQIYMNLYFQLGASFDQISAVES